MSQSQALVNYLSNTKPQDVNPEYLAYLSNLASVKAVAPAVAAGIIGELESQRLNLKLIASENYSSLASQSAMGNLLTDKYAEGYVDHRFYAGCDNVDAIEGYAAAKACEIFGADFAYVQPHSGADANLIAYWAILSTKIETPALDKIGDTNLSHLSREQWETLRQAMGNQRLMGLDYYSGGHLTHGYRNNVSARMFDAYTYSVNPETNLLDYDAIEKMAMEIKPLILLAGYSAYPRLIDFKRMREIADKCGAVFMVDMAHFAGLVAGKVFTGNYNPVAHAQVVTTTTHKTLRGPRGGMVLCTKEFQEAMEKGCPLVIGGPLPHIMASKAVAFTEAAQPSFKTYAQNIVLNAKTLAAELVAQGNTLSTGGTDNHLMLIDVRQYDINGRQAENAMRECGITLNRNSLPFDPNGPWYTSGLRIGTPAVTTLGMGTEEMKEIASIITLVLKNIKAAVKKDGEQSKAKYILDENAKNEASKRVHTLLDKYPVYPQLDLVFLKKEFT
ncbi:MAG: glycine hydroxymethyltransferase [Spirochaetales bacterium]|nr:glycine hydroxymethyltransferase [Spirochaetales bacterium]